MKMNCQSSALHAVLNTIAFVGETSTIQKYGYSGPGKVWQKQIKACPTTYFTWVKGSFNKEQIADSMPEGRTLQSLTPQKKFTQGFNSVGVTQPLKLERVNTFIAVRKLYLPN